MIWFGRIFRDYVILSLAEFAEESYHNTVTMDRTRRESASIEFLNGRKENGRFTLF